MAIITVELGVFFLFGIIIYKMNKVLPLALIYCAGLDTIIPPFEDDY